MTITSPSPSNISPEVQRFIDIAAIKELHIRYCRGVDRMDWDLIRSIYHPDAVDDHRKFRGSVEEFIEWAAPILSAFVCTTHFCGNQYVEVEGDSGWMESSTLAFHRRFPTEDSPAVDYVMNLRYVDVVERRDGEWRILDRTLICESESTLPVGEHARLGPAWLDSAATRDRTDRSYTAALVAQERAQGGSQRLSS